MTRLRMALLALAILLSGIDAVFSLGLAGPFSEVNPVLRPLLSSPPLFLLAKLAFTGLGLALLARMRDSRLAGALLVAGVLAYLVVDAYWVWRWTRLTIHHAW